MLNLNYSITSDQVSAVIFPCSEFEKLTLLDKLFNQYEIQDINFAQKQTEFTVDWIQFIGITKPLSVSLDIWQIKGKFLVLVQTSNFSSISVTKQWLIDHFPLAHKNKAICEPIFFSNVVKVLNG